MIPDKELYAILEEYPEWSASDIERELARIDFYAAMRPSPFPCSKWMAESLTFELRDALRATRKDKEGYRVRNLPALAAFRALGMAGYNGPYLTTYGMSVRRAMIHEDKKT